MIANALVSSPLDYCNSLFRSLSSRNATRLQYVQNALARFVTGISKFTHITSSLKTLHWLPIRQRIIFKTLVLVYKYLTTGQPKHFAPYLSLYKSAVNTRRSNPKNLFLQVPHYCSSIHKSNVRFNNSFSYDTPKLWNDLPHDIRSAPDLSCFKRQLKTYLFQKSFPPYLRTTEHRIASLGMTWNLSNGLKIYALRTGWCALESVDTEIKHLDN